MLLGVEETTIDKRDTIVFMVIEFKLKKILSKIQLNLQKVVHLISVIGVIFSILFHIFVQEPSYGKTLQYRKSLGNDHFENQKTDIYRERASSCYSVNLSEFGSHKNISQIDKIIISNKANENRVSLLEPDIQIEFNTNKRDKKQKIWSDWLKSINFWRMCLIYMMSRLFVNLTQVYTPLYLQESLKLAKVLFDIPLLMATLLMRLSFKTIEKYSDRSLHYIFYWICLFSDRKTDVNENRI